jgi:hypothetical protein
MTYRPESSPLSRRQRFVKSWFWVILKNVLGWALILAAFVAGPLVPGPAGIPLFLIGFTLISFPGKRRLTARFLRGRPLQIPSGPFVVISLGVALALSVLVLWLARRRYTWVRTEQSRGWWAVVINYLIVVAIIWLLVRGTPRAINILLRLAERSRRRFRPWLRRHRVRLLPPRWRVRHAHEPGLGRFRLKDEILKLRWRG